jgi:hypothetical protein
MRFPVITAAAVFAIAAPLAAADIRVPQVSPAASLTQELGLNKITITYHRPGIKGRKIWGALVPYGEVWRTGANEPTTIAFAEDVVFEGHAVPAGTYAFFAIPGESEWTLILNKNAKQWGAFSYDATEDIARWQTRPQAAPIAERLEYRVDDPTNDTARIVLHWEKLEVSFGVKNKVDTNTRMHAELKAAVAAAKPDDWRTLTRAANYYRENSLDLPQALAWADKAVSIQSSIMTHFVRAEVLAATGRKADAAAEGRKAIALAGPDDKALAGEIRKMVVGWEGK